MRYRFAMKSKRILSSLAILCLFVSAKMPADEVDMQNGDRYFGKVVSVSADTVVMNSEMLGKINVQRQKVSGLLFGSNGTNAPLIVSGPIAHSFSSTNLATAPVLASSTALGNTNVDLSAAFRQLGTDTNFLGQIRQQMLAGSPEAAGKYDQMVNGLMNGSMNLNDLRQQAKASADQLRQLKSQLGPDADDSLNAYLEVLDNFVKETDAESAGSAPAAQKNSADP